MSDITPEEIEEIKQLIQVAAEKLDTATSYNVQRLNACVEVGKRFIDLKAKLGHGRWIKWLDDHIGVSAVTTSRWMKLAKLKAEGKIDLNNKSIRDAYITAGIIPDSDGTKAGTTTPPQSVYILHATRLAAALARLDVATLSEVEVWALRARLRPIVEFAGRLEGIGTEERED
jgi:hypothetical protein